MPEQMTAAEGISINWYFIEELPEFIITIFILSYFLLFFNLKSEI